MTVLLDRPPRSGQRAPLALELGLYLAAMLVAIGATFIVARFWTDLGSIGQLAIGLLVAAIGYTAARSMEHAAPEALARPTAAVRTVGIGGVALSAGVLAHWAGADSADTIALAVGPPVFVLGLLDWRNRDRPLPFVITLAGLITTAGAAGAMLEPTPRQAGTVIWLGAMVMLATALRASIRPTGLAAVLAVIGSNIGATAFGADQERIGVSVALASLILVLVLGLTTRSTPVIAVALTLIALTLPRVMAAYLHGLGAALGMLLVGVIALGLLVPRLVRSAARKR